MNVNAEKSQQIESEEENEIVSESFIPLKITLVIVVFCLGIFFYPFLIGYKSVGIDQSVKHNMYFFEEVVKKYVQHNMVPPKTLDELINDAERRRYHKTFYNPVRLVTSGTLKEKQINQVIVFYSSDVLENPEHLSSQANAIHAGKVGYFSKDKHYYIYGHGKEGQMIQENGKIFILTNDQNFKK